MKQNFDEELMERIRSITGLSGNELYCLTGTVYATVFLGKIPTKEDLATYLGISSRTTTDILQSAIRTAVGNLTEQRPLTKWMDKYFDVLGPRPAVTEVIYPLATELVSEGLFFDSDIEPTSRFIARIFLQAFFDTPSVQTLQEFVGYNTILEYLWAVVDGTNESIDDFISCRFDPNARTVSKIQAFTALVYQQNPHIKPIYSPDYHYICEYLADNARKARNQAIKNGSAKKAKTRVERMILEDA